MAVVESCGAYIGAVGERQAIRQTGFRPKWHHDNFTKMNPA
jgi:hypothetical protein